jgi:hypothetical protein
MGLTIRCTVATQIERRLHEWMKDDQAAKAIALIPGVGLLIQ